MKTTLKTTVGQVFLDAPVAGVPTGSQMVSVTSWGLLGDELALTLGHQVL